MEKEDVICTVTLIIGVLGIFSYLLMALLWFWFGEIGIVKILFKIGGTLLILAGFGFLLLGIVLYLEGH